jgi:hypothetical protein
VWNSKCKVNLNKHLQEDPYKKSATKGKELLVIAVKVFAVKEGFQLSVLQTACIVTSNLQRFSVRALQVWGNVSRCGITTYLWDQ